MELSKLFKPRCIAVVGASDKPGFGLSTCSNLLKSPKNEHIYFVNPRREEILGKRCYASIASIPEPVDMCVIILNKSLVNGALREAAAAGCRAAIVYASGYGETGDHQSEKELAALCKELDMAVMGVNCAGYINNIDDIFAFGMLVNGPSRKGDIAIISQSGKICLNMMQIDYMKYSYLISGGNSTSIYIEDYLEYLIEDKDTNVIGLYMEGIKAPDKFANVFKRAAVKRKPIVVLKVGRSEAGSRIASSHTGSLSGSDKAFDAVCRKFGVIRVDDIEELVQTCHMFSVLPSIPQKPTFCAMNLSGGETGICADIGAANGIIFPPFSNETLSALKNLLPDYASPANPLDMTATLSHDGEKYAEVIKAVMNDPEIGMVICGQTVLPRQGEKDVIYPMSDGMALAANARIKPLALMNFFNSSRDPVIREKLESAGVPLLPATGTGFKLLRYLSDFARFTPSERNLDLAIPSRRAKKRVSLSESESKRELANNGIRVPDCVTVYDAQALAHVADIIQYPAVAKIDSPDILHKSDVGGVVLNIANRDELMRAYDSILKDARMNKPDARIKGVLIQPMLPAGVEMIVGVNNDPQLGPMVLCGLGGVFVEVFQDVSLYPAPLGKIEAMEMIRSLKGFRLLQGYRGSKPSDIEALADLLVQVSDYAAKNKDTLLELDINPVFVHEEGKGADIADALIVKMVND